MLQRNPEDQAARQLYNYAVARLIGVLEDGAINPWERPVPVAAGGEKPWQLSYRPGGHSAETARRRPSDYRLIPCDTLDIQGRSFQTRYATGGLGAALVAVARKDTRNFRATFAQRRTFGLVTAPDPVPGPERGD